MLSKIILVPVQLWLELGSHCIKPVLLSLVGVFQHQGCYLSPILFIIFDG